MVLKIVEDNICLNFDGKINVPMLVNGQFQCTRHFAFVAVNLTMLDPIGHNIFDLFRFCEMHYPSRKNFARSG